MSSDEFFAFSFILFLGLAGLVYVVFKIIGWGKIGKKCGYNPLWIAIFMMIPIVRDVLFFIMAFKKKPLELIEDKSLKEAMMEEKIKELESKIAAQDGSAEKAEGQDEEKTV